MPTSFQVQDATVADWYKTSPFAMQAPQNNAGLLAPAPAPQITAPDTTGSVAKIDVGAYDPAAHRPAGSMTGGQWQVAPDQTVQGQLTGLLAKGSPLMTQAATRAAETANSRGLLNSSMAVGAGQAAVIGAALPIAQQDASTFATAGRHAADTASAVSQFNATQGNALQSQLLQQRQQAEGANAAAANAAAEQTAQRGMAAQTANLSASVQQAGQQYEGTLKAALANADAAGKLQLQQIDAATRTQLAEMQARYNVQMQASSSMAQTYQSLIQQSAGILADQNLDYAGKQAALNSLATVFNNAMGVQSAISGLNLGQLLSPDALAGGAVPQGAAPAPAYGGGLPGTTGEVSGG